MANLSFRSLSIGTDTSITSATDTADLPTGALEDDLGLILYVSYFSSGGNPVHTTPSGWTARYTQTFSISGVFPARVTIYDQILPASPGGVTLTSDAAAGHGWRYWVYDNPNTSSHFDTSTERTVTTSTNFNPTAVTTAEDNELLVGITLASAGTQTFTFSPMTERDDTGGVGIADRILATAGGSGTDTNTASASGSGFSWLLAYKSEAAATPTLDQSHFRWRNDDGSETTATWAAAEDADISVAALTPKRLRMQIAATGDPDTKAFKLQYRKVGDTDWQDVN